MKLFSRMLSKKPDTETAVGRIELDMDVEPLRRRDDAMADDSGLNPSRIPSRAEDPLLADPGQPIHPRAEEPEEAAGAGWGDNAFAEDDEDWDDEADWGEEEDLDLADDDKAALVDDIRGAVGAVSHVQPEDAKRPVSVRRPKSVSNDWANDEEFGRKAIARSRIGSQVEGAEERLLSETNHQFTDSAGSRRRSAMAHLKKAAAATKADKVLSHVVGRDPTLDPEEQSPYRDDLAKVVRPRSTSRPISRPVSRGRSQPAPWDEGVSDDDAAMFAAASEQSVAQEAQTDMTHDSMSSVPDNLSAEDFADDDSFFTGNYSDDDDLADDDLADDDGDDEPARPSVTGGGIDEGVSRRTDEADDFFAGSDDDDDDFDADEEDDFSGPVPSTAVSEAIAIANGEMDEDEDDGEDDDDAVRRQLAEISADADKIIETTSQVAEEESYINVASAVSSVPAGRSGRSAGRVKTRLLGFQPGGEVQKDVFETGTEGQGAVATEFPVGWIVVIDGPGRGKCFTIYNGVSNIGRGEDQAVRLDFGDTSISRNNHAAVAYDQEQASFFLGHGGKSNLVRLNGKPVLSTEEMTSGDEIRIGETVLKFVSLCGSDFSWQDGNDEGEDE